MKFLAPIKDCYFSLSVTKHQSWLSSEVGYLEEQEIQWPGVRPLSKLLMSLGRGTGDCQRKLWLDPSPLEEDMIGVSRILLTNSSGTDLAVSGLENNNE